MNRSGRNFDFDFGKTRDINFGVGFKILFYDFGQTRLWIFRNTLRPSSRPVNRSSVEVLLRRRLVEPIVSSRTQIVHQGGRHVDAPVPPTSDLFFENENESYQWSWGPASTSKTLLDSSSVRRFAVFGGFWKESCNFDLPNTQPADPAPTMMWVGLKDEILSNERYERHFMLRSTISWDNYWREYDRRIAYDGLTGTSNLSDLPPTFLDMIDNRR